MPLLLRSRTRRSLALAALASAIACPAMASPPPSPVTPDLVAAAQAEGKVVFYVAMDLEVAQGIGKAFEAKYPGVAVQIERSGSERILQRVAQEYGANLHVVDAIESIDAAHPLYWKSQGWLAAYVPQDVAAWPEAARDPDGFYAADRATMAVVAYNTKLVKPEEAPRSYADLLDAKWAGKMVKSNPSFAGSTLTATFALSRALGWEYFQKLGRQRVMQVQSGTEPPKKIALGERQVMVDGTEYVALRAKEQGAPIALVYPSEGTPLLIGSAAVMKEAPHPNAARLFISFLFSRDCQQMLVDKAFLRSFHPEVSEPAGRTKLAEIKTLASDPAEVETASEEVKRRYAQAFGM